MPQSKATQWRSQNAEKCRHIKGRLLDQSVILFNCVPFSKRDLLLKERICSKRERIISLKNSSLWYGKSLLPHYVTSLECYYFITHVRNCVMGAVPVLPANPWHREDDHESKKDNSDMAFRTQQM